MNPSNEFRVERDIFLILARKGRTEGGKCQRDCQESRRGSPSGPHPPIPIQHSYPLHAAAKLPHLPALYFGEDQGAFAASDANKVS